MQGTEAIAQILKQEGTEYLFSYPNHPLIDAAARIGIRPLIARGEKTLINMADGYTRAINGQRPTVVVVQAGPGIENAFGALAQAFADSVPLLIIPGGPDQHRLGEPPEFDPLPVYRNITRWAARLNFTDRIPELMRRAFAQLRNGKPGPVLLELPRDVGAGQIDPSTFEYQPARGYRSAGDPGDVAAAAQLLVDAHRPVLHVGHGVLWAQAWDELRTLAELVQAPVLSTMAGKSVFPENHPLSVGASGHTITRTAAHFLVRSDLVFGIGCSFARGGFSAPIPHGKKLVQVTLDARDIDKDYVIDQAIVGDARLVLGQLIDEVKRRLSGPRSGDEVQAEIRQHKEAERREWLPRLTADETPINPYRVIWDLNHTLDRANTIITHDSGNPRDQTLTMYEAIAPRGYLGWGKSTQLGTGLGMALGAKLAYPDKTVVNIMGDLAFGTVGMEVETAVRERLPIITVILNNSVMGGYGHHMPTASERFGANRLSGSYAGVAQALGAHSERVERPDDVVPAILRAIAVTREGTPAVLEMITKEEPVYPAAMQVIPEVSAALLTAV
ncbi:MAG TPA: thiamine pyrophosphate-requiring protein [Chloroflexota bacterium]|nr:thiamine pyrophosphate-requiring protein [Chloroflexota bacterium]